MTDRPDKNPTSEISTTPEEQSLPSEDGNTEAHQDNSPQYSCADESHTESQSISEPDPGGQLQDKPEQRHRKGALPALILVITIVLLSAWLVFHKGLTTKQAWLDQVDTWWRLIFNTYENATNAGTFKGNAGIGVLQVAETVPEAIPETNPETFTEADPEAIFEAFPEATHEAVSEVIPEATPEAAPDVIAEITPEAARETTAEAVPESEENPNTVLAGIPQPTPEQVSIPTSEPALDIVLVAEPQLQASFQSLSESEPEIATATQVQAIQTAQDTQASQALANDEQPDNIARDSSAQILFGFDSTSLSVEAKNTLDEIASAFKASGFEKIQITGYSDGKGEPDYNLELSRRRADAAAKYLVAVGIDAGFLQVQGLGVYTMTDNAATDYALASDTDGRIVRVELLAAESMF